jgi:hypothetical protein
MFAVLGPYIAEGIRRGDGCAVICSPEAADLLREWLKSKGLDVLRAEETEQLVVHAEGGVQDEMTAILRRLEAGYTVAGLRILRTAWDAGWVLRDGASLLDVLRWEAVVGEASGGSQMLSLFQFDLTRFGGDVVMGALRTHPFYVMGQVPVPNPSHVAPEALFQELSERQ